MRIVDAFRNWRKKLPRASLVKRDEYILARCTNRQVVHLGACDAPSTLEKASRGELLHQKLQGRCANLVGYDIDAPSIDLLRERFGIADIVARDLAVVAPQADPAGDIIICADIIEHVDNAGALLVSCNRMLSVGGDLLISTIHALSFKHALRTLLTGVEIVHPDHVSYYSYATLGVLLDRFGFEPTTFRYFTYPTGNRLGEILDGFFRMVPYSANGILVEAKKVRNV
jgi:SAM-dependent methyltransferase